MSISGNLYEMQDRISQHVKTLTAWEVRDDMYPDGIPIPMGTDGKIKPYIVLRFGVRRASYTGGSMRGPRMDEYWSTVDVVAIADDGNKSRRLLNGLIEDLIGWKPDGVTPLSQRSDAGDPAMFTVSSNESRPTQYVSSTRLRFSLNGVGNGYPTP